MRRFKMLVFSEPIDGQDAEFNEFYTGRHLDDVCAMPPVTATQRFKLHSVLFGQTLNKYLAIYDVETDDPDGAMELLFAAQNTAAMPIAPVFNLDASSVMLYEEITEKVVPHDPA